MTYATVIEHARYTHTYNRLLNDRPNMQTEEVLNRHDEETQGSQYPTPQHQLVKVSEHSWDVEFYYPNDLGLPEYMKTFNGKYWS